MKKTPRTKPKQPVWPSHVKVYLVGGAIRDQLLGLPIKEKDWVVTGATVQDMLNQGFRQVGKDFPVFLHPQTQEEYALARVERKTGKGYTGFAFDASPEVTLEDDLLRRDLTINAMAQTLDETIIDPYHGQEDLAKRILRHVSPAFIEDPVRILRVARFAARFDFTVAGETLELMKQMVALGEVDALVPERVWKELERALVEKFPVKFFEVLAACGALNILFPQLQLQNPGLLVLAKASRIPMTSEVRFAILLHSLSKEEIVSLCKQYRVPTSHRDLALLVQRYLADYQQAKELKADALLKFLQGVDAFRREIRFKEFLFACEICSEHSSSLWLYDVLHAAMDIDMKKIAKKFQGKEMADKVKALRLAAIEKYLTY